MKRLPFDDPGAFRRRWSHLGPDELLDQSLLDPLLFAADHLPVAERREGTVVIVAEIDDTPIPVVVVLPDGPPDPAEETCLGVLSGVIAQIDDVMCDGDDVDRDDPDFDEFRSSEDSAVRRLGVVTHRVGSPTVSDRDLRWMRALGLVSVALGIDTIGVLTRTRSGALVRVPDSTAA